ncbi:MAG: hypothetical protein ABFC96_14610 [Thermoguttaceae bacterium]
MADRCDSNLPPSGAEPSVPPTEPAGIDLSTDGSLGMASETPSPATRGKRQRPVIEPRSSSSASLLLTLLALLLIVVLALVFLLQRVRTLRQKMGETLGLPAAVSTLDRVPGTDQLATRATPPSR